MVDPGLLDICSRAMLWPDEGLPRRVACGFPVVGKAPVAGIYRAAVVDLKMKLDEFLESSPAFIDSLMDRTPPPKEKMEAVWQKSCEEQAAGIFTKAFGPQQLGNALGLLSMLRKGESAKDGFQQLPVAPAASHPTSPAVVEKTE